MQAYPAKQRCKTAVLVVGLGAMGSSVLYALAQHGVNAMGVDRLTPPHTQGSSHGGSRVTREAVGEGAAYVPLVQRSHQRIVQMEAQFHTPLMVRSGTLIVGSPSSGATPLHGARDFLSSSVEMAQRFGIAHDMLDADALQRRFPQFKRFRATDRGYFEPNAGYMLPEALIATQLQAAQMLGAQVLLDTPVHTVRQQGHHVLVQTSAGDIVADRVVVCAGAWMRRLLGAPFDRLLTVTRQLVHWYDAEDYSLYTPDRYPVFIWFVTDRLEDYFTGFPVTNPAEGVKMVASRDGPDIDHETMSARVDVQESLDFYDKHVGPNMHGVKRRVINAATCFYTNTPDNGFIVDQHPGMSRVMVVSACSGHGFKHAVGIGEAVAQRLCTGVSDVDLSAFRLARFSG